MRRRHRRGGTRGGPVRRPCQALARLLALSLGIAAATGWNSAAAATLTEHMDIACTQQDVTALHCDYRLLEGGTLKSAAAEHNGSVVEGDHASSYPGPGDTTAVLALVDTSDPARQPVVARIVAQLDELREAGQPHHRFGLASFDSTLEMLAPLDGTAADFRAAAATLSATGRTTELYRNVREAVRLLGNSEATRRVLVVFSDGLAEDFAYHHEDVVSAARDAGVIIHGVGYPRSVAQSVALQTIRRLSDETGGLYVQADPIGYTLPPGIFRRLLAAADSGGELSFDLVPLLGKDAAGAVDLTLAFQTSGQSFLVLVPVLIPREPDRAAPPAPPAGMTDAAPTTSPIPARPVPAAPAAAPAAAAPWRWILLVLLAAILVALLVVIVRLRRTGDKPGGATPLAWVVRADAVRERHAIGRTPWRIGRGRNNDLVLDDHSVSRLHAEIRRNEDGQLTLNDLESLNGVFVNDNRIDAIQLREGDAIDIGDVRLQFTLKDESYASQDETVVVRTRTPL